jgi:deazaflavin-dependent oxidoreductase (nitroreductase family)
MARTYHVTSKLRLANSLIRLLIRLGLAPKNTYLLTVCGRKSGKPYSTPVTLVEENNDRWLVSPYGEVNWVRNARAAGQVTLSRGRQTEVVDIVGLSSEESAPVLKKYLTQVPIVRPYFDVRPDSPIEAFTEEASHHPVFRILKRDYS